MTETIPSPLGLLHRSHHAGTLAATDALVLSFGQDLAFFERAVLGVLSQTKARITLLGDAGMVEHDSYSVRRSGTSYLAGVAVHRAAFHPKMMLLVSEAQATLCIGSGNLTLSGWQGNDELWTVHQFDPDNRSHVATDAAAWLERLSEEPGGLRLSEGVAERLQGAASKLRAFGDDGEPAGVQLISSLDKAIIDQLPKGPVSELALYAPYHDGNARALTALIDHFEPSQVRLAYQARHTSLNGEVTAKILADRGVAVAVDDQPFRHGKLIEWVDQSGGRIALVGSPNLSDAALLRSAHAGGNVELAIVAAVPGSLLPGPTSGEPPPIAQLSHQTFDGARAELERVPVFVLDATRQGPVVVVRLMQPLPAGSYVELSYAGSSPDSWQRAQVVGHSALSLSVAADMPGGSRVRVRFGDGTWSRTASVVDFDALRRAARSTGKATKRAPDVIDVFGEDGSIIGILLDALSDMSATAFQGQASQPSANGENRPGSATYQGWDEYLDACQERLGDINLSFALGLPIQTASSGSTLFVDWDDDLINDEAGALEGDFAEDDQLDDPELSDGWFKLDLEREARRRYRVQIERFIDQRIAEFDSSETPDPDPVVHLVAIRLILLFAARGVWLRGEEWRDRLLRLVGALDRPAPDDDWETSAASLAALSVSVVDASLRGPRADAVIRSARERVVQTVGYLTLAVDGDRIAHYAEGLSSSFRYAADVETVLDLAERINNDDPLARAAASLVEDGVHAEVRSRVLVFESSIGDPKTQALRQLSKLTEASPIGVYVGEKSRWALALWGDRHLFVVQPGANAGTAMFFHYHYDRGNLASDLRASGSPSAARHVETVAATFPPPDLAVELARKVGLEDVLSPDLEI